MDNYNKGFKLKISTFGGIKEPHILQYDWNLPVQAGNSGIVFSKDGNYKTAFFEAFPENPSCFIRGEGDNISEAETIAWNKYQKILNCNHEMERRDRKDGYGYCKHCDYSSMVFETLNTCKVCNIPTNYFSDINKEYYCKKHSKNVPTKLKYTGMFGYFTRKRYPRKKKKLLKQGLSIFVTNKRYNKVYLNYRCTKFTIDDRSFFIDFKVEKDQLYTLAKKNK